MTTSERLAQLERAQIANNEQFTILTTVIGRQGQDIKSMRGDINAMRQDIAGMREDMHSIAATLERQGATLIEHTAHKMQGSFFCSSSAPARISHPVFDHVRGYHWPHF